MSTLAFDIAQFIPLLNHHLLPLILEKTDFDSKISIFFQDYLVGKKIKYLWNSFSPSSFNIDIGIGQSSALSPILTLSFINDGLFVVQDKFLTVLNSHLFCSYYIMSLLLKQFGLVIKHRKTEVFHFSRSHKSFNPFLLDFMTLEGSILHLKETW